MATATKQARTSTRASNGALIARESKPMQFLIFEANGGDHYWTLLDRDGKSLARSPSYFSYQDAEDAARDVLAGAGSARLCHPIETDSPIDNMARRDEAKGRDDPDAERWLDEGGSFSRKAARR